MMAEIKTRKRTKEERAEALLEFQEKVALDADFAREAMGDAIGLLNARLAAANAAQDRLLGKPPQALQHTGADGGPILGIITIPPKAPVGP
jgi:hypothetical protein